MKTFKLVSKGITSIGEVKRSIADFVKKELFHRVPVDKLECLSNQGYHPAKKDPWNHVLQAITAQKYFNDDQELLGRKIEEREEKSPSSKFFRPHHTKQTKEDDDSKAQKSQLQQNSVYSPGRVASVTKT